MNASNGTFASTITGPRPTVGDAIYDMLMEAVFDGRLAPGERINDISLANELGVSRTPVREALQKLRSVGIVESEPNRFTRIAAVTPEQVRDRLVVWTALMEPLIREVVGDISKSILRGMGQQHKKFAQAVSNLQGIEPDDAHLESRMREAREIAEANFKFFTAITPLSANKELVRALETEQHVIRLGSLSLPNWIDLAALSLIQESFLSGATDGDGDVMSGSIRRLSLLAIPGTDAQQG
ncbi:GntR family transcriptional regulator [Microbacterium rhizomatis]|uniref:GntR family transcriptional regulator n=1 Tax=Microbacterium rhizomatis TaxID=1631477 RepID=A0A5J5IZK8_9MICO|nr:GntR family transcriptional regulator [Microbacterium rhizomatis]KAA9107517.1 GntR family transcriptional regulator [Microbacterium rhizomatis]